MGESKLTHVDSQGVAKMVDVSGKEVSRREAVACSVCRMSSEAAEAIRENGVQKGDVLQVARLAALAATKRTDELILLCHTLPLDSVEVDFEWIEATALRVTVKVAATGKTGVEMEALVGASLAALNVYDMCKAIDRGMVIEGTCLVSKSGGVRGDFQREDGDFQRENKVRKQ